VRKQILMAFAASALLASVVPASLAQTTQRPKRFTPVPSTGPITPAVPLGPQREMTVVLKMAGDPVALIRARAHGKQLSEDAEKAIAAQLRAQQDALEPAIAAHGVKVLAKMQHAINGIKVRGTASQIASLARLPGVVGVKPVLTHKLNNAVSVPFIGAPAVWQGPPGIHGEHIKIGIIDTGIDFTHANFSGPGTPAAYKAAFATNTMPADPALFGPGAPKVKGGTDLVGDNYDASSPDPAKNTPMPDPNPLDCNGHGSHVAGTAAGFGVTTAGTTFTGPYDSMTPHQHFIIGPGVAPLADLYAIRVFGCSGSTNVVVEAINWAVQNHMNVINMSLGADFGTEDSADAEASENAVEAGIVVAIAAGNAGPVPYILGSPGSADKALTAAAMDARSGFPGATMALSPGGNIIAQDSNGSPFSDGTMDNVVVLKDAMGHVSLGCNPAEYTAAGVAGKLVVTRRGTCARVARAIFGQQAGAVAVAMINNAAGYPPFEGPITMNPDNGMPFNVTIPFFGVRGGSGPTADGTLLAAAASLTLTNTKLNNPAFRNFASFTSEGPRLGDGHLKPDVTAPGVGVFSTLVGTGTGAAAFSGTSMATPHVAGVGALTMQAHPTWSADEVRLAVVNTADSTQLNGYTPRLGGAGLVQPFPATRTSVIARAENEDSPSLNFGVEEFSRDFKESGEILVRNLGSKGASFSVSAQPGSDSSPHSVTVEPSFLHLPPGHSREVRVRLEVPAATSGDSSDFREVTGLVSLTPASPGDNAGTALNVPYYVVARARSEVEVELDDEFGPANPTATVELHNESHSVTGTADFYAWGLTGMDQKQGSVDLRAVGVQSFDAGPPLGQLLVFSMNTFRPWSNAVTQEFDVLLDINGDGIPDFQVVGLDLGLVTTGGFSGQVASFVLNLSTGALQPEFFATAPTDGSTILLAVVASDVGITAANPRFTYTGDVFDLLSPAFSLTQGLGKFNAFNNALSTGAFAVVNPDAKTDVPLTIDPTEWKITPALGVMVVGLENRNREQARLLPVPSSGGDSEH